MMAKERRGNLLEIHSEIGTLFLILVHHDPNYRRVRSEMCCIYSLEYWQTNGRRPEAVIWTTSCTFGTLEANAVMSKHRI